MNTPKYVSPWMDADLEMFRETVSRFVESEMVPHDARWREQHGVGPEIWRKAGENGLLRLGLKPTPLAAVVPAYLAARAQRGRYAGFRRAARRDDATAR